MRESSGSVSISNEVDWANSCKNSSAGWTKGGVIDLSKNGPKEKSIAAKSSKYGGGPIFCTEAEPNEVEFLWAPWRKSTRGSSSTIDYDLRSDPKSFRRVATHSGFKHTYLLIPFSPHKWQNKIFFSLHLRWLCSSEFQQGLSFFFMTTGASSKTMAHELSWSVLPLTLRFL